MSGSSIFLQEVHLLLPHVLKDPPSEGWLRWWSEFLQCFLAEPTELIQIIYCQGFSTQIFEMLIYCSEFNLEIFFLKTITKFKSNSPSGHKKPQQSPLKLLGIKKSIVFKLIIFL